MGATGQVLFADPTRTSNNKLILKQLSQDSLKFLFLHNLQNHHVLFFVFSKPQMTI